MFVDVAEILVRAGRGGNGAVAFHREKYVPAGGPDGGDGGDGGDVMLEVDDNMSTLMDFKYKKKYIAPNGEDGRGARCFGKGGKALTIRVPRGTLVRDKASGALLADMSETEAFTVAKGGRGGWGNAHFATPTRQTPRFAKSGLDGEERQIILELKLLADVGLIGFPNVGKSTLLSIISAARPKIANYHFTTLVPNLGIVSVGDHTSFAVADIPGLIEGASDGAGLGIDFLRHVERCRLLIHVVDVAGSEGRDPVEDFEQINSELFLYSEELASRPQIVAANKADLIEDEAVYERFVRHCESYGMPVFRISAATTQGVRELMNHTAEMLQKLPPIRVYEPDPVVQEEKTEEETFTIARREDGAYVVAGKKLLAAIAMVNPDDYESLNFMQRVLRTNGVFDRLEAMGIQEGDTVSINNFEFEYVR